MGVVLLPLQPRHLFPGLSENEYKLKMFKNMLPRLNGMFTGKSRKLCLEKIEKYEKLINKENNE